MPDEDVPFIPCKIMSLPEEQIIAAAATATRINPANAPAFHSFVDFLRSFTNLPLEDEDTGILSPRRIAILTTKWWNTSGIAATVSFVENTAPELQDKIIAYANKWNARGANIHFSRFTGNNWQEADIRISRAPGGYYSYLGTDNLHIQRNQNTMNLEAFVLKTPTTEYDRVVPHEFCHYLGAPHEHMRKAIIDKLVREATISYYMRTQGWSQEEVIAQVLTPISEVSIMGTPADEDSVMCYMVPGECTTDGLAIRGGRGIEDRDYAFMGKMFPATSIPTPTPTPTPPVSTRSLVIVRNGAGDIVSITDNGKSWNPPS